MISSPLLDWRVTLRECQAFAIFLNTLKVRSKAAWPSTTSSVLFKHLTYESNGILTRVTNGLI